MADVEIAVEIVARTPLAFLVSDGGDVECWVPKSQISDYTGDQESPETIFIPEWLALDKGLL